MTTAARGHRRDGVRRGTLADFERALTMPHGCLMCGTPCEGAYCGVACARTYAASRRAGDLTPHPANEGQFGGRKNQPPKNGTPLTSDERVSQILLTCYIAFRPAIQFNTQV